MQRGSVKPWQIGVFVVAIGAIVFGVYTFMSANKSVVVDELLYVDVQTGDLFSYRISKSAIVPATNPDTGNASLVPVEKTETGYQLRRRFLGALDLVPVTPDAVVNAATGEVKVSGKSIRRLTKLGGGKIKTGEEPPPPQDTETGVESPGGE
jgi:hypothetical protein